MPYRRDEHPKPPRTSTTRKWANISASLDLMMGSSSSIAIGALAGAEAVAEASADGAAGGAAATGTGGGGARAGGSAETAAGSMAGQAGGGAGAGGAAAEAPGSSIRFASPASLDARRGLLSPARAGSSGAGTGSLGSSAGPARGRARLRTSEPVGRWSFKLPAWAEDHAPSPFHDALVLWGLGNWSKTPLRALEEG